MAHMPFFDFSGEGLGLTGRDLVKTGFLDLKIRLGERGSERDGERKRESVLAEFFEGDLGDLGECVAVENICDGVAHIEHEEA